MARPTDWHILDLTEDPAPGDPYRIRELVGRTRTIADDAESAARNVRGLAGDQASMTWIGAAGDVFKDAIGKFPGQLDKVAHSHHLAADALGTYADDLDTAQGQADRALSQGRQVYDQVRSLHSQLATASATLTGLDKTTTPPEPPDPEQVKTQARKHTAAQQQVGSLTSQLSGPQAQLDAAKKLAQQAAGLRDTAAETAGKALHDAADAGIPPDSFWHKLGDIAATVWHYTIIIAKVLVAVLGVVALIVGGPIAWIVFGLALLVLADTIYQYTQGRASLWDVALAALSCIPMTKGLTTLAELKTAFEAGGLLGAGVHVLGAGWGALKGLGSLAKVAWEGKTALPGLIRALPFTAWGKLTQMSTELRYGATGLLTGFGGGFADGTTFFGSFRSGFTGAREGWDLGGESARALPSWQARAWQGSSPYVGTDIFHDTVIPAGTKLEVLHPTLSGFGVPEGTMAKLGLDSTEISRGVQVGPSDVVADTIPHNFRSQGVTIQFNADTPAATGIARANSQFGPGGQTQFFVPNIADHIASGTVTVVDANGGGRVLPMVNNVIADTSGGGHIPLTNFDLPIGSPHLTSQTVGGTVTFVNGVGYGSVRGAQTGADITAPTR